MRWGRQGHKGRESIHRSLLITQIDDHNNQHHNPCGRRSFLVILAIVSSIELSIVVD